MTFEPKYNFAELAVGQSFEIALTDEKGWRGQPRALLRVRQAASQHKRRHPGWDYSVKQTGPNVAEFRRLA